MNKILIINQNTIYGIDKLFVSNLFGAASSHSLEAKLVCFVDLWDLNSVLLELLLQLGSIELAVASASLENLGLLVKGEVLPREIRSDILLEQAEHLVVGDCAWVGEVVDASVVVLGHNYGSWQQIVEDGVGVGYINHSLVLGDFGNEVARVQVVRHRHTKTKDKGILVGFHDLG